MYLYVYICVCIERTKTYLCVHSTNKQQIVFGAVDVFSFFVLKNVKYASTAK